MSKFSDKSNFEVRWHPFQLAPDAPTGEGVNKMAAYRKKYGEASVERMLPFMIATGRKHGINFSYGGNIGNTFDSHRLISLAEKQGKQDALVEELFCNYFEQEKCISDHRVLLAAAQKVGVEGAKALLTSHQEAADVEAKLRRYQGDMQISGVPFFIFEERHSMPGALESEQMERIFQQLLRE